MSQDLSTRFKNALNYIKNAPADVEISNAMKLKFYGLFKQATDGPCNTPAPSRLRVVEKAKHDAWKALGIISKEEAKKKYIEELTSVSPKWENITPKL